MVNSRYNMVIYFVLLLFLMNWPPLWSKIFIFVDGLSARRAANLGVYVDLGVVVMVV